MGYASKLGRARINARSPQAAAICDRCGFAYNHTDLRQQMDWRGASLANLKIMVCPKCYDVPQQQLRSIIVPADPIPVQNPRIQDYVAAETNYRTTSGQDTVDFVTGIPIPGTTTLVTQDGDNRVTQQTGEPPFGRNTEPGTDPNAPGDSDPGLPYNNVDVPKTGTIIYEPLPPTPDTRNGAEILLGNAVDGFAVDFLDNSSAVRIDGN